MTIPTTGSEKPVSKLPGSTNGELQKLWKRATAYEHEPCYQNQQSYGSGWVHPVTWLPGSDRLGTKLAGGKPSNPHEFPWVHTAGFDKPTQKYVSFPTGEHIEYTDREGRWVDHGDVERVVEWRFPVGTTFAEVLTTHGRTFEVRTRTKNSEGRWIANVYRPYADAEDLKQKLRQLGTVDARKFADAIDNLPRKYSEIRNPHPVKTFEFKGHREDLPEIPESLAETILSWDFEANANWKADCHAPSTRSDKLSIVAKDYQGFIVRPDSKGCAQCHDTTLASTSKMEFGRDWYGRVRGSDGIFSFHIFDSASFVREYPKTVFVNNKPELEKKEFTLNSKLPLKKVERFTHPSVIPSPEMRK